MSAIRRAARLGGVTARRLRGSPVMSRYMNTAVSFEGKERAEETRYIHKMEDEAKAAMRAKVEKLLAEEDHHEDRQKLEKLLAEPKADANILADWKFATPLGILVAIPTISNEVLVIDAETQLAACFAIFLATMYTQVGPMLAKSLDDQAAEIAEQMKQADDSNLLLLEEAMKQDEKMLTVEDTLLQTYAVTDHLAVAQADVLNQTEEHMYRNAIAKKLDSLATLENVAVASIKTRMLSSVKSEVVNTFKSDKKAKDSALNQAIAVLAAGGGKRGKDVVGEAFGSALKNYKQSYASMPEGSDEILVQLEKDMAAVAAAPLVEGTGGNVFLTHPVA